MRPECYSDYAKIYDYFFADGRLFPGGLGFMRTVAGFVGSGDRVTDVGGGTGFFTAHLLLWRKDIRLTFIEPSSEMMALAKKKLPETCSFIAKPFSDALHLLGEKQRAIIFMRSFYAIAASRDQYPGLFAEIYNHLDDGGFLFIKDLSGPLALSREWKKKCMRVRVTSAESSAEFGKNWSLLETIKDDFNQGLRDGVYHVFLPEELHAMLSEAGFQKIFSRMWTSGYSVVYQKVG